MDGHPAVREGGNPGASLEAANFAQVRHEAVVIVALSSRSRPPTSDIREELACRCRGVCN
jgi:hypothetical protein